MTEGCQAIVNQLTQRVDVSQLGINSFLSNSFWQSTYKAIHIEVLSSDHVACKHFWLGDQLLDLC